MRSLSCLVRRNIALFMNNPMNILLSFATIPIVLSLYAFFLRDFLIETVLASGIAQEYVFEFTDRMMLAGLLVVINTTTCFGVIQICVNDTAVGIRRDFLVAPVRLMSLLEGYWLTSIIVSAFYSGMTALGGELIFWYRYQSVLPVSTIAVIFMILIFCSCLNAGILLCFAKNLNNTATFCTFANLYGTVIGFLSGSYLPYYFYPEWLKPVLFWFPPMQMTSILRKEYTEPLLSLFTPERSAEAISSFCESFGIVLTRKDNVIQTAQQYSILLIALAVLLLYLWISSSMRRMPN